jgi:hypothetical protein
MKTSITILILCSCIALGYGLESSAFNLVNPPSFGSLGFRSMGSTATFSMISGSNGTWGQGAYVGTMGFTLHPKVNAMVDLGYARTFDFSGGENFGHLLGGLQFEWKPTDNSTFVLQYQGVVPTGRIEGF